MKRLKPDNQYASIILEEAINNQRFETIIEYILFAWREKPNLRKREILNACTIEYLTKNKGKKNENIIRFYTNTINN
jgi:hypothetical protein